MQSPSFCCRADDDTACVLGLRCGAMQPRRVLLSSHALDILFPRPKTELLLRVRVAPLLLPWNTRRAPLAAGGG